MALSTIKTIPSSIPGVPFFDSFQGSTIPGSAQTLIDFTVPNVGVSSRNIYGVAIACIMNGRWVLTVGVNVVASGFTGAGSINSFFSFLPPYPAQPNDVVQLVYVSESGDPATELDAYLQASDI